MTRIGTFGSNQLYLSRLNEIQQRVFRSQTQVATELKSQNYTGIARDTNLLLNMENERSRAQQYIDNNNLLNTRLKAADVSLSSIETTMKNFRTRLNEFHVSDTLSQQDVEGLQKWAFQAMKDMESYLAANVDGKYLFSGGRTSTEPVQLGYSTLTAFQDAYDGMSNTYPTSRSAHLLDMATTNAQTGNLTFNAAAGTISAATAGSLASIPVGARITAAGASAANNKTYTVVATNGSNQLTVSPLDSEVAGAATISWNGGQNTLTFGTTGNLTFAPGADTITSANAAGLASLPAGTVFTVSGTTSNDGVYQVESTNGTNQVTITSTKIGTTETVAATLTASSWYKGDSLTVEQRVDADRQVEVGIHASDPAFEKAIRAMGLIAQGEYGTAGGLEKNWGRVQQALYLVRDALDHPADDQVPSGLPATELASDMPELRSQVGTLSNLIKIKNEKHTSYIGFLATRTIEIERIDKTEAVTRLLDDQNALEASYQALSEVRSMSLLNFLQ